MTKETPDAQNDTRQAGIELWVNDFLWHWQKSATPERDAAGIIVREVRNALAAEEKSSVYQLPDPLKLLR